MSLESAKEKLAKRFEGDIDERLQEIYVAPYGGLRPQVSESERFLLLNQMVKIFTESDTRSLLILGDSGAGKTSFCLQLCKRLWEVYREDSAAPASSSETAFSGVASSASGPSTPHFPKPLPVYIHLAQYKNQLRKGLLEQVLKDAGLTTKEIRNLKITQPLLLLLDGFDEVNIQENLYQTQRWGQPGYQIRMAITCRPEALVHKNKQALFEASRGLGKTHHYETMYLQSFTDEQIHVYLERYIQQNSKDTSSSSQLTASVGTSPFAAPSPSSEAPAFISTTSFKIPSPSFLRVEDYLTWFERLPSLKELIKTPFLLTVAVRALPGIIASLKTSSSESVIVSGNFPMPTSSPTSGTSSFIRQKHFTQSGLFKVFLKDWFFRQAQRVKAQGLLAMLSEEEIQGYMEAYAKNLAASLIGSEGQLNDRALSEEECLRLEFIEPYQDEVLLEKYHHRDPEQNQSKHFFEELRPEEKTQAELQKSHLRAILSGCMLRAVGNQFRFIHKSIAEYLAAQELMEGLLGNYDSYLEDPHLRTLWEETKKTKKDEGLNRTLLIKEPQILARLEEMSQEDERFKELLEAIIVATKTQRGLHVAAANAISILNKAGVNFCRKDFSDIKIPEADLSESQCEGVRFDRADLRGVNFCRAYLARVNFQGANLEGVNFGERASWKMGSEVSALLHYELNSGESGWLVGCNDGLVHQVNDSGKKLISYLHKPYFSEALAVQDTARINAIAVHNPRSRLSVSGSNNLALVWNMGGKTPLYELEEHREEITSLSFNSRGELASGSVDGTICLWDPHGQKYHTFQGKKEITALTFTSDDQLASASKDNTICLWRIAETKKIDENGEQVLRGHTGVVTSLVFTPSKRQLASGSLDTTIRLWGQNETERLYVLLHILQGHSEGILTLAFAPGPEGQLASAGFDMTIRLWEKDGTPGIVFLGHTKEITALAFSSDGKWLASGSYDKTIRLWRGNEIKKSKVRGHTEGITSFALSSDGQCLASGSYDRTIRLWQPDGIEEQVFPEHHTRGVTSLAFSPDNVWLASGSSDKTIRLWGRDGKPRAVFDDHQERVTSLVFVSNSQLASGSWDDTIRLWNIENPQEKPVVLRGHIDWITSLLFHSDKGQLISSSLDKTIHLWLLSDTEKKKILSKGHLAEISSLVLSPSKQLLASGSWDNTIRLWNMDNMVKPLRLLLKGHRDGVTSLAFISENILISGSWDKTLRIWIVPTGELLHIFETGFSVDVLIYGGGCLYVGGEAGYVMALKVEEEPNFHLQVQWIQTGMPQLVLQGSVFQEALNLSEDNKQLCEEKGGECLGFKENLVRRFEREMGEKLEEIYINPLGGHCSEVLKPQERFSLLERTIQVLTKSNTLPLCILGDTGTGKTSFCLHLWKYFVEGGRDECLFPVSSSSAASSSAGASITLFPIYIDLSQYKDHLERGLLEQVLQERGGTYGEIENLKKTQSLLLLLDEWDEVGTLGSLYQNQGWGQPGYQIRILITARSSAFQMVEGKGEYETLYLQHLTEQQIQEYLEQYEKKIPENKSKLSIEEYLTWFERLAPLKMLIKIPFLLAVAAEALPGILQHISSEQRRVWPLPIILRHLIQRKLLKTFLRAWYYRSASALNAQGLFPMFSEARIQYCIETYAENLAASLMEADGQWKERTLSEEECLRSELVKESFFLGGGGALLQALLSGSPLRRVERGFRFLHPTIAAYLAAQAIIERLLGGSDEIEERLNRELLTKEFHRLTQLAEAAKGDGKFRARLETIILGSREPKASLAVAAANAITILNRAGVAFWNRDFSGIQIPGADLTESQCRGASFERANLSGVIFRRANLEEASFEGANMEGVDFGERAFWKVPSSVICLAHHEVSSGESEWFVGCGNGYAYRFNDKGEELTRYRHKPYQLSCVDEREMERREMMGNRMLSAMAIHGPTSRLATGGGGDGFMDFSLIWVWRFGGAVLYKLDAGGNGVTSLAFSPEGHLASGSNDNTIRLWEADGTPGPMLQGHTGSVVSLAFSPKGRLASGSNNNTIRLWEVDGTPGPALRGHTDSVRSLAFSSEGYLASGGYDRRIRLWEVGGVAGPVLCGHKGWVTSLAFGSEGCLVSGGYDGRICLWESDGARGLLLQAGVCTNLAFSSKGRLASAGYGKTINLWEMDGTPGPELRGHTDWVRCLAFSPGGRSASGSDDNTIRLWEVDGTPGPVLRGHRGSVLSLAFSPEGRLASGSDDKTIRLWGGEMDGAPGPVLRGHTGSVVSLAFSPEGRLASGSTDGTIWLWQVDGTPGPVLRGHTGWVKSLAFSAGGWLVSGSDDKTIRLWFPSQGSLLHTFPTGFSICALVNGKEYFYAGGENGYVMAFFMDAFHQFHVQWVYTGLSQLTLEGALFQSALYLSDDNKALLKQRVVKDRHELIFSSFGRSRFDSFSWEQIKFIKEETPLLTPCSALLRTTLGMTPLISEKHWLLSMVRRMEKDQELPFSHHFFSRNRRLGRKRHGVFIIEGVREQRRFIIQTVLAFDDKRDYKKYSTSFFLDNPSSVQLDSLDDLEKFKLEVSEKGDLEVSQFPISAEEGEAFLNGIQNKPNFSVKTRSSMSKFDKNDCPCLSWCFNQLGRIDRSAPIRWSSLKVSLSSGVGVDLHLENLWGLEEAFEKLIRDGLERKADGSIKSTHQRFEKQLRKVALELDSSLTHLLNLRFSRAMVEGSRIWEIEAQRIQKNLQARREATISVGVALTNPLTKETFWNAYHAMGEILVNPEMSFTEVRKGREMRYGLQELVKPLKEHVDTIARTLKITPPCCLISYSWGVGKHVMRVHALAKTLRLAGIDVKLDIWNKQDRATTSFKEQIQQAHFILLMGSIDLVEKWERSKTSHITPKNLIETEYIGHLVVDELKAIQRRMLKETSSSPQIIYPIILNGDKDTSIPFDFRKGVSTFLQLTGSNQLPDVVFFLLKIFYGVYPAMLSSIMDVKNKMDEFLRELEEEGVVENTLQSQRAPVEVATSTLSPFSSSFSPSSSSWSPSFFSPLPPHDAQISRNIKSESSVPADTLPMGDSQGGENKPKFRLDAVSNYGKKFPAGTSEAELSPEHLPSSGLPRR